MQKGIGLEIILLRNREINLHRKIHLEKGYFDFNFKLNNNARSTAIKIK